MMPENVSALRLEAFEMRSMGDKICLWGSFFSFGNTAGGYIFSFFRLQILGGLETATPLAGLFHYPHRREHQLRHRKGRRFYFPRHPSPRQASEGHRQRRCITRPPQLYIDFYLLFF
jgi:hypothetical protein